MNLINLQSIRERERAIVLDDLRAQRRRASIMFAWLMIAQWIGAVVTALVLTPYTWIGAEHRVHQHVWIALVLGLVLTSLPIFMASRHPDARSTRHVIATAQMAFSSLLIHLSGGRVETHFHIFGSLAFLAFFRDWQVLVTATLVVTLDHFLRNIYLPLSIFGTAGASQWRWVEHASWVLFEDAVLFVAHAQSVRALRRSASDRAALERGRNEIEAQVVERTRELLSTAEALRRSEEETRAAMETAEAASRAKSQFLANMSHEIRTPMSAIMGYADVIAEPDLPQDDRQRATARIRSNAEHLLGIIDDILDLSKIEAGTLRVHPQPCDPRRVCEDVAAIGQQRAADKGISFVLDVAPGLPRIISDSLRLRQVLVNLVSNAVKFTAEGEVRLAASWAARDDGRLTLRFVVRDTGIGMTAEQMSALFRPFSQGDDSMSRRFGGTGLGLFISQKLAGRLGGEIGVRSKPEHGSEFIVELAVDPAPAADPEPVAAPLCATASPTAPSRIAGRVLVAEDGPDNQRLISHMLTKAGASVTVVSDGEAACAAAEKSIADATPFDLILMDMQMPVLDGYAATARLRAAGWTRPVVALTAHAMLGDRERCIEAGCNDYITKPVNRTSLLTTCARWLAAPLLAAA